MKIKITTEDIRYAEKILLPKGKNFDTERRDFIKNLDTIDLQAVPGSGKTTALLAKLLILERYMPFDGGSGVLVISHTNTAVDEIKNKIGKYCPRLFAYPNLIGTIQSFVDKYLAIPFYTNKFGKKPYRIDDEIYNEKVASYYEKTIKNKSSWIDRRNDPISFLSVIRYDNNEELIQSLGRDALEFRPKKTTPTSRRFIAPMKRNMMKFGYLHFDDAYFLANQYIKKLSQIEKLLQQRFKFVFVDEMQDMDRHQHDVLEELFFKKHVLGHCYQRIGDKNQAIYGGDVKLDDIWSESGRKSAHLKGSHRLTQETATVVKYFGLNHQEVQGLRENEESHKPHIIVFDNPDEVLPKFAKLIKDRDLSDKEHPFCAIGWRAEHEDADKLGITDYCDNFEKKNQKSKIDYHSVKDYLKYFNKEEKQLTAIRKNILNIFVKILRIENERDENDRNYTTRKFLRYLKEEHFEKHEELKLKIFEWSFVVKKGEDVHDSLKTYVQSFFSETFPEISFSQKTNDFINLAESVSNEEQASEEDVRKGNFFEDEGVKIKIGTVHSVKGETHTATLYMESFYSRGRGNYESERLVDQLKENKKVMETVDSIRNSKDLVRQSAKMVYVGFSRPTHLLCFAVHSSRLGDGIDNENWEVTRLDGC